MARRALAILTAGAVVLAGCTGGAKTQSGAGQTSAPTGGLSGTIPGDVETAPPAGTTGAGSLSPQAAVFIRLFVEAAGAGKADALWDLLSRQSRQHFGPTFADFENGAATSLEEGVGSFAGTDYGVILAVTTPGGWGVAAVAGQRVAEGQREFASYAVALRPVRDTFRIELGGPVELTPLVQGSQPLAAGDRVSFGARAPGPIDHAALWVDGRPVDTLAAGSDPTQVVVAGRPSDPLVPGPHVGIAFAQSGDEATAVAWTFDVR